MPSAWRWREEPRSPRPCASAASSRNSMPFFSYKGRNARGELVQGVLEGATSGAVADRLRSQGITPIDIAVGRGAARKLEAAWLSGLLEEKITPADLIFFSRQMYTLLKAGVPILRALAGLQGSSRNRKFAAALADVRESLDSGRELSVSLARQPDVFSPFYVNMVRVGETTGMLEEVFLRLFRFLEFEKRARDQIRSALRYPMFVVIAMVVALAVINLFVIPAFAKVYQSFHAELPLMTRLLIGFSDFWVRFWPLMLAAAAFLFYGARLYVRTPAGRYQWDRLKLRLPVIGSILHKATLGRFARGFSLASKSGVPIVQGFSLVAQVVENAYLAQRIEQMREGVERGESISRTALNAGVFSPVVLQMIAVGEETGELDDLMQEIAEMYEREVEHEVANLSANIEPILIVGLAIMVLILALGVFLPLWDLGKAALAKQGGAFPTR